MELPTIATSATPAKWLMARLQQHNKFVVPTADEIVAAIDAARVVPWEAASDDDELVEQVPVPASRQRKRSLASTLMAARRAGADRVIVDGVVIVLAPAAAVPNSVSLTGDRGAATSRLTDSDANEWDAVLPEGDHGPN
jgi:hypothetical protein